jgi:phosphoribosylanthranilate isomerase
VTVLLDARDDQKRGGTGRQIDWTLAARVAAKRRIMLAGGVDAGNVEDAIRTVRPFAIDVSSGVERAPGVKDHAKMQALFEAVKRC